MPQLTMTPTTRPIAERLDELHPLILGLLKTLPELGSEWTIAERVKWLQTASSIFGLIYKGAGDVNIIFYPSTNIPE